MSSSNDGRRDGDVYCDMEPGPSKCVEEVTYDPLQIEDLEHYGLVEEVESYEDCEAPFPDAGDAPHRPRRRATRSTEHIPATSLRRQPHRASRVKSFKQLLNYSDTTDYKGEEEFSAVKVAPTRVFITNDVAGLHLDWPLYSQQAESFATAAHIIVSDAAMVRSSLICLTVPQEFTEVGTFVIAISGLEDCHDITQDGLGSWGSPQGTTKFYHFCFATRKLTIATPEAYTYKVQCNRYIHPGTDERGQFIRKIFCGMTSAGESCSHAVVTYSWEGTPHPITVVVPSSLPARQRPYGARSWEAADIDLSQDEGIMHRGQPLLSRVAVDFSTACKVLLGAVGIAQHRPVVVAARCYQDCEYRLQSGDDTTICFQVPRDFRDGGTFLLDIESCGGERMLCRDGHEWLKPSGSSRYFRFNGDGTVSRVDRAGVVPPSEEFDVQILAKRYECSDVPSFVRKIYIARDKSEEPRVNTHVAVMTYHWKSEPAIARANRDAIISRKRHAENPEMVPVEGRPDLGNYDVPAFRMRRSTPQSRLKIFGEQIVRPKALPMLDALSRVPLSHGDQLRRLALTKKSENLCRLEAILDRAEPILERFEQYLLNQPHDGRQLNTNEAVWVEQHQLANQGTSAKDDQRAEECIIVGGAGEQMEVPPDCLEIVYEDADGNGSFS